MADMNVPEFQARWGVSTLTERASAQSYFLDLCELVGHQKPAELDPAGSFFTFEKSIGKTGGGAGFADVWYRGRFAWENKRPGEDLDKAYRQLKLYAEALENPPLLIVSDIQRIIIHTNWTNTVTKTYEITLDSLSDAEHLKWLRDAFYAPESLQSKSKREDVTKEAAVRVGRLALSLHERGEEPARVAHFLVQLLFCLFAEDVGLLPRGLFARALAAASKRPEEFTERLGGAAGGDAGAAASSARTTSPHFNGGLFATVDADRRSIAADLDDPARGRQTGLGQRRAGHLRHAVRALARSRQAAPQLGAHYTGRDDIERVVDPVVMTPLRRRWDDGPRARPTLVKTRMGRGRHAARRATTAARSSRRC